MKIGLYKSLGFFGLILCVRVFLDKFLEHFREIFFGYFFGCLALFENGYFFYDTRKRCRNHRFPIMFECQPHVSSAIGDITLELKIFLHKLRNISDLSVTPYESIMMKPSQGIVTSIYPHKDSSEREYAKNRNKKKDVKKRIFSEHTDGARHQEIREKEQARGVRFVRVV
jgi:hypothetical protein